MSCSVNNSCLGVAYSIHSVHGLNRLCIVMVLYRVMQGARTRNQGPDSSSSDNTPV